MASRVIDGVDDADVTRSLLMLPTACGGTAYVLGVEHLSPSAAALVRQLVRGRRPQTVVLELDEQRARALGVPLLAAAPAAAAVGTGSAAGAGAGSDLDVAYPARGGFPGVPALLFASIASAAMGAVSELYAGQRYGGELVAGAAAAREVGARLVLADRDLALTLQRAAPELPLAARLAAAALDGRTAAACRGARLARRRRRARGGGA